MTFAQLVDEVTKATEEELGDAASLTDGTTTLNPVAGFFHREFDEELSDRFGIATTAETWEMRAALLQGLDLGAGYSRLRLTFGGRVYKVQDARYDTHINALLLLSK